MLLLWLLLLVGPADLADAAKSGNIDRVRALLVAGADPNTPDGNGIYPLDFAAYDNRVELCRLLLEYHASVRVISGGSTPLDIAVARGSLETVRILIDNGGDVRRMYPSGRTPLHIAALNGRADVAGLLVDRGADVEARDRGGMAPLDLAIARSHIGVAGLLLDAGAKPSAAQLRSALKADRTAILKLLIPHASEALAPLLKDALARHRADTVDLLLAAGADVNARDEAGFTPLHDAALAGNAAAVRMLLDHGADINLGDKENGATALYMAATMGREEVVTLLLDKGADPGKGPSPLRAAVSGGFDRIAEMIRTKSK